MWWRPSGWPLMPSRLFSHLHLLVAAQAGLEFVCVFGHDAFVVARDWRSKTGSASFTTVSVSSIPSRRLPGSFVVAVSLEPRHQCLKSLARLVGTLALVGFLHRLEHVGVTRLGKVRAKISEFMDLAPLDDRDVLPEN